ncbi:MAG: hypothetical protein FWB93_02730 [Oscillospiraceae bacterium]|nr:hypothetical protein [Oscillospiraceae bacterium]
MKNLISYLLALIMLFAVPFAMAGCGEIDIPSPPPENHVVRNPWEYYCHVPMEERVTINLSGQQIDDDRLAEMVQSGEIPAYVTHLNLRRNMITDISPLAELSQLALLEICGDFEHHASNMYIQDISPLSQLIGLCCLYLGDFYANDFGALRDLANLTRLIAHSSSFLGYTCSLALSSLENLVELSISIDGEV